MRCKQCGMIIPGRYQGDYDATQYHARIYHFDIVDSYNPYEVRDLIEIGKIRDQSSEVSRS